MMFVGDFLLTLTVKYVVTSLFYKYAAIFIIYML